MGNRQGWQIGVAGIYGKDREVPKATMDAGEPAIVVNIEKRRIREGIDAAERHPERSEIADRTLRHGDEFVQPIDRELVAVPRSIAQEAKFLDRDVEEMVRMQTNEWQGAQRVPNDFDLWRER